MLAMSAPYAVREKQTVCCCRVDTSAIATSVTILGLAAMISSARYVAKKFISLLRSIARRVIDVDLQELKGKVFFYFSIREQLRCGFVLSVVSYRSRVLA
jgi:hypothetical protein